MTSISLDSSTTPQPSLRPANVIRHSLLVLLSAPFIPSLRIPCPATEAKTTICHLEHFDG